MEEKILESVVTTFTKFLLDESKSLLSEGLDKFKDELKQFIGKDLNKYLIKKKDKYSKIKTLLRGNTPVYLYDVYFPLKLVKDSEIISTDSISSLFSECNYITIIGDAGSGKSTLVKHLFLSSIKEKYKIPVLIELRYLNDDDRSISDYIKETASMNKLSVNSEILERLLEEGRFVFFLDGYDELESKTKKKAIKNLNEFIDIYNDNSFLLTTRPFSNIEQLSLFHNFEMKDLDMESGEIKGFIFKQLNDEHEIADKIYKSIQSSHSLYIVSFLKNPLLLSLYILTFQSYASIPDKKYIFYRRVVNALFSEHDSKTKLGFVREKVSGLNQEQFEYVLKIFSFLSYFESQFNFERDYVYGKLKLIKSKNLKIDFENNKFINDLKSAIALWVDDDGELSFTHRSLQEFFAALFITELNSQENKRVYQKILGRYQTNNRIRSREIENLLDLLLEMDELNYKKNFYLPVITGIYEDIVGSSNEEIMKNFIKFFTSGIIFRSIKIQEIKSYTPNNHEIGTPILPRVNHHVNNTIRYHIKYTKPLYKYLSECYLRNPEMLLKIQDDRSSLKMEKTFNYKKFIKFDDGIPEEVFEILNSEKLLSITLEFKEYLENEIAMTKEFLDLSLNNEKDMVDLI